MNREIFLHRQEGFCVGKFGHVVDQAVLDNQQTFQALLQKTGTAQNLAIKN